MVVLRAGINPAPTVIRGTLPGFEGFAIDNVVKYINCKEIIATQIMTKKEMAKKILPDISPGVEERVVQVSLKNPDYGTNRLVPLLEEEGVLLDASAKPRLTKILAFSTGTEPTSSAKKGP